MIRVLVIEEVRALCEIIARVLRAEPDIEVVGCATDIDEAVVHLGSCDLAVINGSLTTDSSLRLLHGLRRLAPRLKIVVMGLARNQQAILQCVEARVSGYVLKDSSLDDLLHSIRAAERNETLVAPPLAATLASYVADLVGLDSMGEPDPCSPQSLTRREREVLTLVQQGLTNQEIAESLVIELGTVKNHVHNILRKLNVNSRRDAVHASRLAGVWGAGGAPARPLPMGSPQRPALKPEPASLYSQALGASN